MNVRSLAAALVLTAAACGDNIEQSPDATASPDAGPGDPDAAVPAKVVITAGDFEATGTVATVALPSLAVTRNAVAGVAGADPIIRNFGSEVVIVNRLGGDNVTILDGSTLQLVGEQMTTGAGSNPQDVALVGRKLYVPVLGGNGVVVLDRDRPTTRTTIDLSALDSDGSPECNSVQAVDDEIYVVCGILDGFAVRGNGRVAVIDTTTDTLVRDFDLGIQNPNGQLQRSPVDSIFGGDLLVPAVPDYLDYSTGCLARVSVGDGAAANGCVVSNQTLGGYPNRIVVSDDGKTLWINVRGYRGPGFMNPLGHLVAVDLATGEVRPLATPPAQIIGDVAACPGGWLVTADVTPTASGIRVYLGGAEVTTAPLDIGTVPSIAGSNIVCF